MYFILLYIERVKYKKECEHIRKMGKKMKNKKNIKSQNVNANDVEHITTTTAATAASPPTTSPMNINII